MSKPAIAPRTVITVRWNKRLQRWVALVSKQIIGVNGDSMTKEDAVRNIAEKCDHMWSEFGVLSELRICNKAGQYQPARTYGKDPRSSEG